MALSGLAGKIPMFLELRIPSNSGDPQHRSTTTGADERRTNVDRVRDMRLLLLVHAMHGPLLPQRISVAPPLQLALPKACGSLRAACSPLPPLRPSLSHPSGATPGP